MCRRLLYSKLPQDIVKNHVVVLDPILASGSAATVVLKHLKEAGIKEKQITFVCVISCPEGIKNVFKQFPGVSIVTSMVDEKLDSQKMLVPGIGEFSDRYFGT
jgi:uracil phosphoribosyltransferase